MKKVLHIALKSTHEPNQCMSQAFVNSGYDVKEIDWVHVYNSPQMVHADKKQYLNAYILHYAMTWKPDVIFMQIQRADIIDKNTATELTKLAFVINWTGDVRSDISWYEDLAPHINITLFTNMTDVEKMRSKGFRADYLQVGFDTTIFNLNNHKVEKREDIVFLGNNYSNNKALCFPLSEQRCEMVHLLSKTFASKFMVYGTGWYGSYHIKPAEEKVCYQNCLIAINQNHFDYKKFSSDRLLRIMGSGAFCLTKYFEGIEDEYENKKHLVWWKTFDELIYYCNFYLDPANHTERSEIAINGYWHVHTNCTWEARFGKQLTDIINKYSEQMEQVKNDSWIAQLKVMPKFKKYSQCGEEGYIKTILDNVGYTNRFVVDIRAADGIWL